MGNTTVEEAYIRTLWSSPTEANMDGSVEFHGVHTSFRVPIEGFNQHVVFFCAICIFWNLENITKVNNCRLRTKSDIEKVIINTL